MLKDEILEKIYGNCRICKIPIVYSTEIMLAIEEILKSIKEERPYATLAELFDE